MAGAVGVLVISTIGMGATLALLAFFGGRQVAIAEAEVSQAEASAELREPSKAAPKPRVARPVNWGSVGRTAAVAVNLLVIAFVAYLTLDHFVLNPPAEDVFIEATQSLPTEPPPAAPAAAPGDVQAAFAALPAGDATRGQTVFSAQPCSTCHSLTPDQVIVGPSLAGVATRAETREEGFTPQEYIYQSITNPSAYVVQGFQDGIMPKTFAATLSPQQLADLIAYLMTMK